MAEEANIPDRHRASMVNMLVMEGMPRWQARGVIESLDHGLGELGLTVTRRRTASAEKGQTDGQ